MNKVPYLYDTLRKQDTIKYVLHDVEDFEEMKVSLSKMPTKATICAGVYYKGNLGMFQLFNLIAENGLAHKVKLNFQTHQLAKDYDSNLGIETPKFI